MAEVKLQTPPDDSFAKAAIETPQVSRYSQGLSALKGVYKELVELKKANDTLLQDEVLSRPLNFSTLIAKLENARDVARTIDQINSAMSSMMAENSGRDAKGNMRMFGVIQNLIETYETRSTQMARRPALSKELLLFERVISNGGGAQAGAKNDLEPFFNIIAPRTVTGTFPNAFGYLDLRKSIREPGLALKREIDRLDETLLQSRENSNSGRASDEHSKESRIEQGIQAAKARVHDLVAAAQDITLSDLPELVNSIGVTFLPEQDLLSTLCHCARSVSEALYQMTDPERASNKNFCNITVPKFPNSGPPLIVATDDITFNIPTEGAKFSTCLIQLADCYLALRKILFNAHVGYLNEVPRDPTLTGVKQDLKDRLGSLFNGRDKGRIIAAIFEVPTPQAERMKEEILLSQVVKMSDADICYAFQEAQNMPIFRHLVRAMLSADETSHAALKERLKESTTVKQMDAVYTIRFFIERDKRTELANYIHKELDREVGTQEKHFSAAALLFALEALSENPEISKLLKAWLPNPGRIRKLESAAFEATKDGASLKICSEASNAIMKSFDSTLADYIGAPVIVNDIVKLVAENQKILRDRERLAGNHPKLAVPNAWLFVGEPGVGKTFLVKCIANHFGFIMEQISVELMYAEYKQKLERNKRPYGKKPQEQSEAELKPTEVLSQHIADYMKGKVQGMRDKIKEKGANGGIIFIDEMEAEFLRRNPEFADVTAIERTNITLRAVEKEIEANTDIYFIGCTNHIDLVDSAALRVGRFTVKFFLPLVSKESAQLLLEDRLLRFHIDPAKVSQISAFSDLTDRLIGTIPQFVQMVAVRTCALYDDLNPRTLDYEDFVARLLEQQEFLKRITSQERPQQAVQ